MTLLFATALFLPLYPLSIVLNAVHARLPHPVARFVLLLLWPQAGVLLLHLAPQPVPSWFLTWALLTSGFYALRLLTVQDLGRHAATLATSALALSWGLVGAGADTLLVALFTFALTLPAALLGLLDGILVRRFGAANAGLCLGLGRSAPRLAVILAATVLAAVATPPFPGFFALLGLLYHLPTVVLSVVLLIWLLWAWAAARLLQGFISGSCDPEDIADLKPAGNRLWIGALLVYVLAGFYYAGGIA